MTINDSVHDPDKFCDTYNQQDQDKKDKEWHVNERERIMKDNFETLKASKYDWCLRADMYEPGNEYKIPVIVNDVPGTIYALIYSGLWERIFFTHVIGFNYIAFLEHQFNFVREDLREVFLREIEKELPLLHKRFTNEDYNATPQAKRITKWLESKESLENQLPTPEPTQDQTLKNTSMGKGNRTRKVIAETFDQLFTCELYRDKKSKFYGILVEDGLLNEENEWKGPKTAPRLFYENMVKANVFLKGIPADQAAHLFVQEFTGLSLSSFKARIGKKVSNEYGDMEEKIIQVKESIKRMPRHDMKYKF